MLMTSTMSAAGHEHDHQHEHNPKSSSSSNTIPFASSYPSLYLARSSNGFGWGVFAARPFDKGEIVEMAPMFLRFAPLSSSSSKSHTSYCSNVDGCDVYDCPVLQTTVLNHYHYEYWAWVDGIKHERQYQLSFGYMLYFNHSSHHANIQYMAFGKEPDIDNPSNSVGLGYFAIRDIKSGEELLTDYGGPEWFYARGIDMIELKGEAKHDTDNVDGEKCCMPADKDSEDNPVEKPILENDVEISASTTNESSSASMSRMLVSKLYYECDITIRRRIFDCHDDVHDEPPYDLHSYSYPKDVDGDGDGQKDDFDADQRALTSINIATTTSIGYGNVVCLQDITGAGEILEEIPVLVLPRREVSGTLLEPIMIDWEWITSSTSPTTCDSPQTSTVNVMICSAMTHDNDSKKRRNGDDKDSQLSNSAVTRSDLVEMKQCETVLIPLAGCVSMIARNQSTYNSAVEVEYDPYNASGYLIRVVSTRSISVGETIVVNLPQQHPDKLSWIVEELVLTGQKIVPTMIIE